MNGYINTQRREETAKYLTIIQREQSRNKFLLRSDNVKLPANILIYNVHFYFSNICHYY